MKLFVSTFVFALVLVATPYAQGTPALWSELATQCDKRDAAARILFDFSKPWSERQPAVADFTDAVDRMDAVRERLYEAGLDFVPTQRGCGDWIRERGLDAE